MFEALLDKTVGSFIERCDFDEELNIFSKAYVKQIREDLKNYLTKAFALHSQNSLDVKCIVKQSKMIALNFYQEQMNNFMNLLSIIEFNEMSARLKQESIRKSNEKLNETQIYFNSVFYEKLIIKNQNQIEESLIETEKCLLELFNDQVVTDTSIVMYLDKGNIYAMPNYLINHKWDMSFVLKRPNCVADHNGILVGNEARVFHEKNFIKKYDITKLLGMKIINEQDKAVIPFTINHNNKIVVFKDQKCFILNVESLIAIQLLDIKTVIEKQLKSVVTTGVFTVPSHYAIHQKNALKDVAILTGIDSVEIISEITAAAISYATNEMETFDHKSKKILIISINQNKLDTGVCKLKENKIEHKTFHNLTLISHVSDELINSRNALDYFERIKFGFEEIVEKI